MGRNTNQKKKVEINNEFIKIEPDKVYLQGTSFKIRNPGKYENTKVTCLSGDSLFTSQVSMGDILTFVNRSSSFTGEVKSVTSNTVLVLEILEYTGTGEEKRFERYCKEIRNEVYIQRFYIMSFIKDKYSKSDVFYLPSHVFERFNGYGYQLPVASPIPKIIYTPAGTTLKNSLTVPTYPTSFSGNTTYEVRIDTVAVAQVMKVTCVADNAGSLNDTYFVIGTPTKQFAVVLSVDGGATEKYVPKKMNTITVDIELGDSNTTVATAIKNTLDDLDQFTATVASNVVTITNTDKGKCESSYTPIADASFTNNTTVSARNYDSSYGALKHSGTSFGSYNEESKIGITAVGIGEEEIFTVATSANNRIVFEEVFPDNTNEANESEEAYTASELGDVTIKAGATGFTLLADGSSSTVVGTNDKFKFSNDGGKSFPVTTVEIVGDHSISGTPSRKSSGGGQFSNFINFKAKTGHTVDDSWVFTIEASEYTPVLNSSEELTGQEKIEEPKPYINRYLNRY